MLPRLEPPQNGEYMVAAYVLVAVVLVLYALTLVARARRLEKREAERA